MQPCVNCPNEAVFHVDDPGANPVDFCRACMPPWLNARASAGHFKDSQVVHGHKPDPNAKPPASKTRAKK